MTLIPFTLEGVENISDNPKWLKPKKSLKQREYFNITRVIIINA